MEDYSRHVNKDGRTIKDFISDMPRVRYITVILSDSSEDDCPMYTLQIDRLSGNVVQENVFPDDVTTQEFHCDKCGNWIVSQVEEDDKILCKCDRCGNDWEEEYEE